MVTRGCFLEILFVFLPIASKLFTSQAALSKGVCHKLQFLELPLEADFKNVEFITVKKILKELIGLYWRFNSIITIAPLAFQCILNSGLNTATFGSKDQYLIFMSLTLRLHKAESKR